MSKRGSVKKASNGTWTFVVDLPAVSGRRKQVRSRGWPTKGEAVEELDDLLHASRHGGFVNPKRSTFGDYLDQWLDGLPAKGLRESTVHDYRVKVRRYVIPRVGGVMMADLGAGHLDALYATLLESGGVDGRPLSARTVRYVATLIGRALGDAERQGLVMANVARRATPPAASSARAPEQKVWTPFQVGEFLAAISDSEWLAPLHLAAMTGMRRGEVCGLEWSDVDLDAGVIQVRHTITSMSGKLLSGPTKTKRSRRRLDLDAGTVDVLRTWRRRQITYRLAMGEGWPHDDLVFTYADGKGLHPDVLTAAFRRLSAAVEGLPRIRLHDLRHSHATALLAAGVNVRVVADRLGHASTSFTLDTYGHSLPGQQQEAANAVAALVSGDQL